LFIVYCLPHILKPLYILREYGEWTISFIGKCI